MGSRSIQRRGIGFGAAWICGVVLLTGTTVRATETENLDIRIVPAAAKVVVDGKIADWDLSGGIFACGDAENSREKFGLWVHAMYDQDNLYVLARWKDHTPMNNPGSSKGDYGFRGDCLQLRFITAPGLPLERTSHWTCWRDRDGIDVMQSSYGKKFNEGGSANAKTEGAAQAFVADADGTGYVQEMSIPWKLLAKEGFAPKAGGSMRMTVEPNFTIGGAGRMTIKDIFKAGEAVDRVFTFSADRCWGNATFEAKGQVAPHALRLSDSREFAVKMENGAPVVDWTGLIKSREPVGFKPIKFSMPQDGFVSLNILAPDGTVARQLLSGAFLTRGEHQVMWDGLETYSFRRPGDVVAPGEYTWSGIYHTGIGLRLRGWACNGGSAPWDGATGKENWGGDHGNPAAAASDGQRVYLGWHGAEGGKALVACDVDGNVQWRNIRGGIASAAPVAADGGTVYAFNDNGQYSARAIYRVDAKTGGYTEWTDYKSTDLLMKNLWGDAKDAPQAPSAMDARGGRLFISFHSANTIMVVDGKSGRVLNKITVTKPGDVEAMDGTRLFAVSEGKTILSINVDTGEAKPVVQAMLPEKAWISAIALDKAGNIYAGVRELDQVLVYSPDGKQIKTIGRAGGRAKIGPWTADGLLNVGGLAVDSAGKLWVAEDDGTPKRISVWDTATGKFVKEYFGPSTATALPAAR